MIEETFVVNVQVAVFHEDKILLIHRGKDEIHAPDVDDLPGGKLELTETGGSALEKAARREVLEETGLTLSEPLIYICSALFIAADGVPVVNVVFKAMLNAFHDEKVRPGNDEIFAVWKTTSSTLVSPNVPEWTKGYIGLALQ